MYMYVQAIAYYTTDRQISHLGKFQMARRLQMVCVDVFPVYPWYELVGRN